VPPAGGVYGGDQAAEVEQGGDEGEKDPCAGEESVEEKEDEELPVIETDRVDHL
jgi:hypothetical protein